MSHLGIYGKDLFMLALTAMHMLKLEMRLTGVNKGFPLLNAFPGFLIKLLLRIFLPQDLSERVLALFLCDKRRLAKQTIATCE